ncbi:uncharacterized protein LOC107307237 [Coturnix japonica]|uniref:uncharacterized protein LOC107307237 n=1 Tax=Coturnix japonica TaxID=93934 RepID=UPI000777567D|nr:uncharacterized protein LOC107307237 [Coturnix japonica]
MSSSPIPVRRSAPTRWTAPVGGASRGRVPTTPRPPVITLLPRDQPVPVGVASLRSSFPIGHPVLGAWPGAVTWRPRVSAPSSLSHWLRPPGSGGAALKMAAALEAAVGTACSWGLAPALDLRQHLPDTDSRDVTALLVGAAEGRHVLLTAARIYREPRSAITMFVAEQRPEPVARQLLFLLLATTEPTGSSGLRARAAAILELLGSVRLRPSTDRILRGAAGRLRRWVTAGGAAGAPPEWS